MPPEQSRKPLLDMNAGSNPKLARAFQKLVGTGQPAKLQSPQSQYERAFLLCLKDLDFIYNPQSNKLVHPLAPDRTIALPAIPEKSDEPAELAALNFAVANWSELEFYLPYITLRAKLLATIRKNNKGRPLPPEPDYDEDGFLLENP